MAYTIESKVITTRYSWGRCVFIREVTVSLSDCFHGDRVWIEVHVCSGPLLACSGNERKVVENGGNERGRE